MARGQGVGGALIELVLVWATDGQARRVVLSVRDTNEKAIALFRRHGFTDTGPSPDSVPGEPPERLYVLVLSATSEGGQ